MINMRGDSLSFLCLSITFLAPRFGVAMPFLFAVILTPVWSLQHLSITFGWQVRRCANTIIRHRLGIVVLGVVITQAGDACGVRSLNSRFGVGSPRAGMYIWASPFTEARYVSHLRLSSAPFRPLYGLMMMSCRAWGHPIPL